MAHVLKEHNQSPSKECATRAFEQANLQLGRSYYTRGHKLMQTNDMIDAKLIMQMRTHARQNMQDHAAGMVSGTHTLAAQANTRIMLPKQAGRGTQESIQALHREDKHAKHISSMNELLQ